MCEPDLVLFAVAADAGIGHNTSPPAGILPAIQLMGRKIDTRAERGSK
jgi:hypothetical protein